MAALIRATLEPIIAPLVAEQAALRQTVERQAGEVAALREERGRHVAEVEQARGSLGELQHRYDQVVAFSRWLLLALGALIWMATVAAVAWAAPGWAR